MNMPACTMPSTPTSKKDLDYFDRKKVGSIRDNPKLLKIRQRFESGDFQAETPVKNSKYSNSASAPSSVTLSRRHGSGVLDELLKSSKLEVSTKFEVSDRRHSEGELLSPTSLSVFDQNRGGKQRPLRDHKNKSELKPSTFNKNEKLVSLSQPSSYKTKSEQNGNALSKLDINANQPLYVENKVEEANKFHKTSPAIVNKIQMFDAAEVSAPPIPKRGISPAVKKSMVSPLSLKPSQDCLPPSSDYSSNKSKSSPVKKTILMYEGMSSGDSSKSKPLKNALNRSKLHRKDSINSKYGLHRRPSIRNSFRKSKHETKTGKPEASVKTVHHEKTNSKEDSGFGSSDIEDRLQAVYQTLTTVVKNHDDPYDRLNRVHDVITRVHKGQISSCAACKALPSSISQWPDEETSILRVQCHEPSPHHHPPCICFSCSHSVFSCSQDNDEVPFEDSLYSNACCLNSPDHEGWRQSRRRPICESNGRLCVVNCDMEQRQLNSCYERLCEWNSLTRAGALLQEKDQVKQNSIVADSCESDEGWVDVTDSEDEKNSFSNEGFTSRLYQNSEDCSNSTLSNYLSTQNACDLDTLISKCAGLDLSRCASTEHLYESIADIDGQVENSCMKESPDGSSTLSLKSVGTLENDNEMDSGEWSTESPSPSFDDPPQKDIKLKSSESSYQNRFVVQLENQETAKLNFVKTVLGKKSPSPKRRMSTFFVPWLIANEYDPVPQRNHKTVSKKKSGCYPGSSKASPRKLKQSQSTPSNSTVANRPRDLGIKSKENKSDNTSVKFLEALCISPDLSSRSSVASSAYVRADELEAPKTGKENGPSVQSSPPVEVSVEHINRKSSLGIDHSYILFQPVKEEEVPLYQFYERNVKERVSFCCSNKSLSPVYGSPCSENAPAIECKPQLSVVEQLSPDAQDLKMLWCELPEVKESGILERISAQELKLQEAAFEFIQSQASFIRSLKVLYENFICLPEFSDPNSSSCVLSKHEHDVLFSDIVKVKEVAENLLSELTTRWSDGILIPDICDIIHQHATSPSFTVYVRYCSNRVYQERTLKELKETRLCFLEVLRKLESNPVCQGLSLESFLFLPMQHIARLPLLLDNMFRWLTPESPSYCICKTALEAVHKIFMECNEGARKMERLEEMFVLNKQLEFKECKALPLISASRWLLKKGELIKLEFDKKTFGRSSRCVRVPIFIFLFNDLLVVTKRKSEDCYLVVDYCPRDKAQAMAVNARDLQQSTVVPTAYRYLIYLTLFHNHLGSAVDMIISCALLSERTRWIEAINTVPENKPCEVWEYDCPQVQCVRSYIAQQPDELSLQESDVITVHRKMNDGWYEGRRLRDGLQGWFPASYTMDIPCSRARASNLRQCYRLLMLSHKQ